MAKKFTVADIIAVEQDKETTTAPTQTSGAKRFSVDDIEAAEHKGNEARERLETSMAIENMMLGFGRNKLNAIERAIPDEAEHRAKVDSAYDYLTTKELRGVDDDRPLDITRGDGLTEWITKNYDSVTGKPAEATKSMVLPAGGTMGGTTFIKGNEEEAKAALRAYDNDFLGSRNKMAEAIVNNLPLADMNSDDEDLKAQGRVMLGDQVYNRAEAIQAARRLVSEIMHPTLLRSNKAYRDNYFISTTGKNFEDFKLDKVSEWSSKLAELEKVLSADVKSMSSAPSLFSATGVSPQLAMAVTAEVEGMSALNKAREKIASLKDNDFFAGLDEGFDLVSMLTAGITTMGGNIKLNNVLGKVAEGKALTPSEKALYDVYGVQQEVEQMFGIQGRSGWNNIGLGVGGSAEVVLPMAAGMGAVRAIPGLATKALGTRTAYAAARQAFKKNTWRGLGEAIKQTAKVGGRTIANTGRATAGGLITAPFTPKMWSDFVEKRNEQYQLVDGKLEYTPTKAYKDLYGAIVDQTTEIASEIAGVGLSSFLRGGAKAFGRMLHLDDIADAMGIGLNTRSVFGWRKPNWWRVAEQNIGFSGALSEPLSEVWGDVMRNTMKAPFGMSNFAEMATADYWKTTFAVSAIYGGSLQLATVPSRLAHIQQTMKLGGQAKRALSRIENTALRNNLLSIINNNDYESAAQQMAKIPWNEYSRPDVGYAMDYIAAELPRQVGLGYIEEDMRLNAFRTEANRLANLRYKGVNGNDQTNLIVSAVTPDGVAYTVESGDYNSLDDGLLIVRDANGVKMPMAKNKIATVENPEDYTVTLQNTYTWLYSREVEEQRVQSVKDALAEMKEPTVEQVNLLMANNGFREHSVGDIVALADGRTAEVLGRLPNGNYDLAITENGEATEYANAPFYDVLSDAPMTRDAQIASYMRENGERAEKPAEVAPTEAPAEEVAEEMPTVGGFSVGEVVNTPNGKARITAFGDNGEVMVDMNLENASNNPNAMALVGLTLDDISREVAPAETTTDATTEQVSVGEQTAEATPAEVESAGTTPEIKSVPRLENGEVDYNAITDPDLYAEYFARDMGSKEAASAQMEKMIAATQSEVEKLAKKGDSLVDANAVVANNKEIARLNERINLYHAVQMTLTPAPQVETTATAEAPIEEQTTIPVEEVAEVEETPIEVQTEVTSGVLPNELSEGIATEHLAVVDAMAKMLGVRITFVPEVRDSNGNLQNAKIVGKDIYIAAGATQIETISFLTGHEFTHRMKELSPEQYAKLEDSVRNYLGNEAWEAEMATHTNTYRKVQRNITDEEIAEEVVADFIGRQVRDNNLFTQYLDSIKDKGLVDAIKSVLRAIRDFFRNINATAKDKALDEVVSNLNTLIKSASAKAESAENTEETRYSLSTSNQSAMRYDKVNGTNVKEFFDFLRNGKVFEEGKPDLFHIANAGELLQRYGIKGKFMVGRFTFSKEHTQDEAHNLGVKEWVEVINTINAPLAITTYKGRKNEYRIYTYATINGENICVGVNVSLKNQEIELANIISAYGRDINKLLGAESVNLLYPSSIKEVKQRISQVSTGPNSPLNATSSASGNKDTTSSPNMQEEGAKFSLRELDAPYLDAVERGDMETAQRMVLEAAKRAMPNTKVVDENGNPRVVYHGSNAQFTVFDTAKIGSTTGTADGRGFYFTTDKDYARGFVTPSGKLFGVFLNIENPLSYDRKTITRAQLKKILKEADKVEFAQEGEHYMLSNYADYTVVGIDVAINEASNLEYGYADNDVELIGSLIGGSGSFELIMNAVQKVTGKSGMIAPKDNDTTHYIVTNPSLIKSADPVTYDDNGNVIPLSERFNPEKEDIRYSVRQPIFYSNAEYAVRGIKQEKATPEQWLKMIEKNGGIKAGEDKWLGLSDWLKASDKKTLTQDEVLQYIAENDIQIEEVEYAQFGPGLIDEATRKLEAEMREIGIDAMREKYDGFDDLFEVYNGELLWSENMASEGEYEDFIIANNIVDVNAQANAINETRLGYTTSGLDNKREIALVVPTIEPYNAHDEVHFGDAGEGRAVAWIRFGETTDADGKRVLVIDEIQSKRHQDGREKGYRPIQLEKEILLAKEKLAKANRELGDYKSGLKEKYDFKNIKGSFFERHQIFYDALLAEERAQLDTLAEKRNDAEAKWQSLQLKATGIPTAPFEKNWAELAMKRMLRYAAENGFDKVAWTTGDQQADRYNIGTKIERIEKTDDYSFDVHPVNSGYLTLDFDEDWIYRDEDDRELNNKHISEIFGKDVAKRLQEMPVEEELSGDGLRIGGEGMTAFYDQMLPSFVRKYAKKWGATVGEVTMPDLEENNTMHSVDVTPAMRESVMQGQPKFSLRTMKELKGALDLYNKTSNIDNFVDAVKEISEGVGGNSYLQILVGVYEEENDEKWFAERINNIVGDFSGDYAPYTAGGVRYSLREQVANILDDYDTEGDEYGSMRDVADGVEAIIAEAEEDTTSLENIVNAYRYAQEEARSWGDRMDAGGDDDFELALRSYAYTGRERFSASEQEQPFGSVRAREEAIAMAERGDYASDIYRKTGWYYDDKHNEWRGNTRLHNDRYLEMRSKEEAAMPFFEDDGDETYIWGDISEEIVESAIYRSSEERILAHMKNRHLVARERIRQAAKEDIDNTRRIYNEANLKRNEGLGKRTTNAGRVAYILGDTTPESLSLYDQALVKIALGEVHISWDDIGNKRGLASELGLKKGEKRSYSNITKGATMGLEEFVHGWWQEIGGYEKDIDTQDLRNALIEALGEVNRPTQAIAALRQKFDTALAERDAVIDRLEFDMEQALLAEDERYNNEVEGFKTSEDKRQRIAAYERDVVFFDEAEALGGTLRSVEKKLADVIAKSKAKENELKAKHALKRAELRSDAEVARRGLAQYRRRYEEYKELADAIDEAKKQIRDVVNNTEVLQFRRREINRLINTLDNARSINDLEYISRRLESLLLDISIRQNRENLNRLLNLRLPNGQYVEAWVNNQIASGAITTAEGKRILTDMWRGTNNKGIRVARYVDGETSAILNYLRNELITPNSRRFYVKEKDAEGNVILDENGKEKKTLTADKELQLDVQAEIRKAQQRIDDITAYFEGNKNKEEVVEKSVPLKIEREALSRYITYLRIVDAKQDIEEAHNALAESDFILADDGSTEEQKNEARTIRKAAFEQLNTAKESYNAFISEFNNDLSELLANGRDAYKAFRDAQEEHRKEIINEAVNAIGGRSYLKPPAPTVMQNIRARAIRGGINNAYYSFQMVLKEIDRYAPNGEGNFYKRYMYGAQSAQDNFIAMQNTHFVQIADKVNELWKEEFKNSNPYVAFKALSDAMSTYRVGTVVYKPFIDKDGNAHGREEWPLVVPNAMFLLAMWQQPRYAMAMAKHGITEEYMLELKDTISSIDHRLIKFMDWVRDELLPNTRLEYNAVYREIFGIDMDMEANYFPAKVIGFHKEEKVEQHEPEVKSSEATGIIARTSRGLMPDPSINYFSILAEHLQKMDQWASFQKLNNDINTLTSNNEFKGRMATLMPGYNDAVNGHGGLVWLWKRTAAIMLNQYKPQENGFDAVFKMLQRGWAASNIAWRFMTALKQLASMPVFAAYSLDPECAKIFMQELGFVTSMIVRGRRKELFQAMADEYPTFRKRWTERNAGMEWLTRNISPSRNIVDLRRANKYNIVATAEALDKAFNKLAIEWGMYPNALVDALSVIVGLRTVQAFEEYRISKDKGRLTDEDIELAKVKAAIAINETQQSAEGAYLSVMQMQRSSISGLFVTYLNNTFANHRKRLAGATELYRQYFDKDWLKEMENRYGDKLPDVLRQAQMKALADIGQGLISDFNFQLLTALGVIIPMMLNGDDEEEAWYEVGLDAFVAFLSNVAMGGFVGGNIVTGLLSGYTPTLMPSVDEFDRDIKKLQSNWKDKRYGEFAYLGLNIAAKNGVGVDLDTFLNMAEGIKAIFYGEGVLGVMKLLNTPQSQIDLIAGAKREGETVMEYVTRRMRLEAIFATSYNDAFNEDGKLINRPFGVSTYMLRQLHKDYETAYRRQVVIREEGRSGWNDMLKIDEEYKDVVKAIGWSAEKKPNNKAFESGEYEAPVEGMTRKQYDKAAKLEEKIARRARKIENFVGTDEEYYSLVKEMTEYKKQLIDNYNELE